VNATLSVDDVMRLNDAFEDGYLLAARWTSLDALKVYERWCRRNERVQVVASPVFDRDGYYRLIVDTYPSRPSLAKMKGLEVALRNYADVVEVRPPDDTCVTWLVEVENGVLPVLIPRVLEVFDMLPIPPADVVA